MSEELKPIKNSPDAPYAIDSATTQRQLAIFAYFEERGESVEDDIPSHQHALHNAIMNEWETGGLADKYRKYCDAHPGKTMHGSDTANILAEIRSMP
ncbi:MAG TPA: hypothetical protein VJH33_01460 [Candidatus Paceibacterota bacterium]